MNGDPDFALLSGDDQYTRYFNMLSTAFTRMSAAFSTRSSEEKNRRVAEIELAVIQSCLERLRNNVRAMRIKNTHRHALEDPLALDLKDSGLPNHNGIRQLDVDIARANEKLATLKARVLLKRELVDELLRTHEDQPEILAELSDHSYFKLLSGKDRFFTEVVMGDFFEIESDIYERRSFVFWWGFYDQSENVPYINFLHFEQDRERWCVSETREDREHFEKAIRTYATRAGNMLASVSEIDRSLNFVYPKRMKRICIGPLFSPTVLEGRDVDTLTDREKCIEALLKVGSMPDDFMFFVTEEEIFSVKEEPIHLTWGQRWNNLKSAKQIYRVDQVYDLLRERGVSNRTSCVVLPHYALQHATEESKLLIPELQPNSLKFPYGKRGELHAFSA